MKVGDLVKAKINHNLLGIIVEAYDSPKKLWLVRWMENGIFFEDIGLAHEDYFEVINEGR
jgi:hypothetical protein